MHGLEKPIKNARDCLLSASRATGSELHAAKLSRLLERGSVSVSCTVRLTGVARATGLTSLGRPSKARGASRRHFQSHEREYRLQARSRIPKDAGAVQSPHVPAGATCRWPRFKHEPRVTGHGSRATADGSRKGHVDGGSPRSHPPVGLNDR